MAISDWYYMLPPVLQSLYEKPPVLQPLYEKCPVLWVLQYMRVTLVRQMSGIMGITVEVRYMGSSHTLH